MQNAHKAVVHSAKDWFLWVRNGLHSPPKSPVFPPKTGLFCFLPSFPAFLKPRSGVGRFVGMPPGCCRWGRGLLRQSGLFYLAEYKF